MKMVTIKCKECKYYDNNLSICRYWDIWDKNHKDNTCKHAEQKPTKEGE